MPQPDALRKHVNLEEFLRLLLLDSGHFLFNAKPAQAVKGLLLAVVLVNLVDKDKLLPFVLLYFSILSESYKSFFANSVKLISLISVF